MESQLEQEILPNFEDPSYVPPLTQWSIVRDCGPCGPCVRVSKPKPRYFCRHWEISLTMPIVVPILILYPLVIYFIFTIPYSYLACQIIGPIIIFFMMIMFLWSYFATVCMDPGFLPYNWVQTKKFYYSWQDQLSGCALTKEQIEFAKRPENRPPGSSFSTQSGRYVIRADHICGWVANWVGKRNHKQFMLMNLWGSLYCFALLGFNFGTTTTEHYFDALDIKMLPHLFALVLELTFGLTLISMFFSVFYELRQNRTKIQKWKNERGQSYDFDHSLQEIYGTGPSYLYCCPTPAFDEHLVLNAEDTYPTPVLADEEENSF